MILWAVLVPCASLGFVLGFALGFWECQRVAAKQMCASPRVIHAYAEPHVAPADPEFERRVWPDKRGDFQ